MTDKFPAFGKLVADSFQAMTKSSRVFVTGIDGDELYKMYLESFPAGTNPIFKKFTEHECSCCRQFIRRVGNVVTADGSHIRTVWDAAAASAPHPYNIVAAHMRESVLAMSIDNLFCVSTKETQFGAEKSHSFDPDSKQALTWEHFYTGPIQKHLQSATPDQVRGDYRTTAQVFLRGLRELSRDAVETVLSLIEANNLYRGEEHKRAVVEFKEVQHSFDMLNQHERDNRIVDAFVWANAHGPAARFRNTVIGTLVQDISEGVDVEYAVKSFETKVAPTNYKRTTAVITPGMVQKAMQTIEELGLEPALERRFAVIGDISVNDVKWVDGAAKSLMKGGLGDALMQHAVAQNPKSSDDEEKRAEPIAIDDFMTRILPETASMEVLLKGKHLGNLVSLTAPVHPEPKQLFRWNNDFAWSYAGNVADSIAERVKKAGGKVEGAVLRVSLSWFNFDDLDLHVFEPAGRGLAGLGGRICFNAKRGWTGGELDVDMNISPTSRAAVENVVWMKKMPDGKYGIVVNNYTSREMSDVGFVIEIENAGKITHYSYNKAVRAKQDVNVVLLYMKNGVIDHVEAGDSGVTSTNISQSKWGLTTEQYVKVNAVTLSPNYWGDNASGNKHTFFLLDSAKSDEATRGIYNEFLHPRLEAHRKVFEVIGDKTKCQPTDGQLSGLGFSSTKRDSVVVKCYQGKKQRLFNVLF